MIKAKDKYRTAKVLIEAGNIKKLNELFDYISMSSVAKDLGINYSRFKYKLENIGKFTVNELCNLADLIEVEGMKIIDLAHAQNLFNRGVK